MQGDFGNVDAFERVFCHFRMHFILIFYTEWIYNASEFFFSQAEEIANGVEYLLVPTRTRANVCRFVYLFVFLFKQPLN